MNEISTLLRKEIVLAKAELSEALSEAKLAAISMASGGALLFAGILVLLAAAVLALSHVSCHKISLVRDVFDEEELEQLGRQLESAKGVKQQPEAV